ncbi:MAG: hypothetical protein U0795_11050 [Pirellulales bacterium]
MKLSDALVLDARLTAELSERSIAGQIEFWARLGKAIEPILSGRSARELRQASNQPLSELLRTASLVEGDRRLTEYLQSRPFPHFEPAADRPGYLVRIEQDGTRTVGRFVQREFVVAAEPERPSVDVAGESNPARRVPRGRDRSKR